MTEWLPDLQALAVPLLLAVSLLMLVVADLLLPGPVTPPDAPASPQGRRTGPLSFRDLRARQGADPTVGAAFAALLPEPELALAGGGTLPPGMLARAGDSGGADGHATPGAAPAGLAATPTPTRNPKDVLGFVALAQLGLCLAVSFALEPTGRAVTAAFVDDGWSLFLQRLALAAGVLTVLGMMAHARHHFARRQAELYALLLASLLGITLLVGARDLVLLVVAFELMGIPLYVLATYGKTGAEGAAIKAKLPAEAGLKLYLVGAVSSAVALYGMSLLYGLSGGTAITALHAVPASPLLAVAMAMVLAGFGFKLGLAPFQFWIPDTYQGAPTPFVAFLSVAPKIAGLAALVRLLLDGLGAHAAGWLPPLIVLSVLTMAFGNLLALPQTNLKRMLGNSGVAQLGTVVLGLVAAGTVAGQGLEALLFYGVAYLPANVGLFLVLEALAARGGPDRDLLASLAGLHRRSPGLALAALVCLLSLAGIPFAVGFWAKLYVFLAAWQAGHPWLVVVALALSVLGLFYYLRVARAMYLGEPHDLAPVAMGWELRVGITVCGLATAVLGLYPRPWIEAARAAAAGF